MGRAPVISREDWSSSKRPFRAADSETAVQFSKRRFSLANCVFDEGEGGNEEKRHEKPKR